MVQIEKAHEFGVRAKNPPNIVFSIFQRDLMAFLAVRTPPRYLVTSDLRIRSPMLGPKEVILDPGGDRGGIPTKILQIQLEVDGIWCQRKMSLKMSRVGAANIVFSIFHRLEMQGTGTKAHDYATQCIDPWRLPTTQLQHLQEMPEMCNPQLEGVLFTNTCY